MERPVVVSTPSMKARPGLNSRWAKIWEQKLLYLFVLPAVIFTLVFNYRPMYGVVMAFQKYNIVKGITGSPFVGLDNFKDFLGNPDFFNALRNTILLSILNLVICFPIPIIFAIVINEFGWNRFKKVVQSVTYLPHFVSWVIVAGPILQGKTPAFPPPGGMPCFWA